MNIVENMVGKVKPLRYRDLVENNNNKKEKIIIVKEIGDKKCQ